MPSKLLASFGSRIISCLKHRLVTPNGRVLLHMSVHFGVEVQGEETFQEVEGLGDDILGDAVVLNVEESNLRTGIVYVLGNFLPCVERGAVYFGEVDSRNRSER